MMEGVPDEGASLVARGVRWPDPAGHGATAVDLTPHHFRKLRAICTRTAENDMMSEAIPPRTTRRVLVAGATGLVGREVVGLLAEDPGVEEVRALVRRRGSRLPGGTRVREVVTDFDALDRIDDVFAVDQVICALGSTIAQAGSQAAFRRVDYEYPLEIARRARAAGARHFLLVSSLGADERSGMFYSRVKGELEAAVAALGFPSFVIARPSLLLGAREVERTGEQLGMKLAWLFPARWKPVHARQVARALVHAAAEGVPGTMILDNRALRAFPV